MKILMVGTGGYAAGYLRELLGCTDKDVVLEGIVDPYYDRCAEKEKIDQLKIPVYDTMEEFYAHHTADIAVISTPTFLHKKQSICALANGSYVLCEKPLAPTLDDAFEMAQAEKKYGKWIAIGYQMSFSDAMQGLKRDVLQGLLGKPVLLKTAISAPRGYAYYKRGGGWGGKISKDGALILDSIASNACAHYMHNMLFTLGETMESSIEVADVCGDCLRANDIENFDTCSLKLKTVNGTDLLFYASHATGKTKSPIFEYTFENATAVYSRSLDAQVKAIFPDGTVKIYGDTLDCEFKKLWDCVDAVKDGTTPISTVSGTVAHVGVIGKIYREIPIKTISEKFISEKDTHDGIYVNGLYEKMYEAYDKNLLLSDVWSELFE